MEVILLERIEKVGKLGDVVKVKDGFARNYLLPQNKALRANKENLSVYEKEKEKYEKLNKDKLVAAEKIAKNMDNVSINIVKQASDSGQLYGSVSTRDIADELNKEGYKVEKKQIVLKSVIKTVGEHEVRIVIHPEHIINIMVNIGRTLEELTIKSDQIENISESNDNTEKLNNPNTEEPEEIKEENQLDLNEDNKE
ncbi:MAG: 50S ribosomal protein L9 [Alphaproteobacteria bacterium]|nr:50S ribosomal protein L9 [Alphaproteobacteria bacterium]